MLDRRPLPHGISVTAHRRVTGPIVVDAFTNALQTHGVPASTLTDNGMVFTTRLSGGKGGRNGFEHLLDSLGIIQKNSRPNHPTTCGKVERFHQTLKRWLDRPPTPATIDELQRSATRSSTSTTSAARTAHSTTAPRPPPTTRDRKPPPPAAHQPHHRVRHDRVSHGNVSLRVGGLLHHIGLGRHLHGTPIIMLINDLDVRVIDATTGADHPPTHDRPDPPLPRHRTTPPAHDDPTDPENRNQPNPECRFGGFRMSRDITRWSWGESNPRPSAGGRTRYDRSRLEGYRCPTGGSAGGLDGHQRLVFPWSQPSFRPSVVFPTVILRFCCRAAADRPRVALLLTMTLHAPKSGGESELRLGNSCCCPV